MNKGVAETLFGNGLCLPSGSTLTDTDIDRVCAVIEATLVAHDLSRGVTRFRKVDRQQTQAPASDGTAEALAELEGGAAQAPAVQSPAA